MKKIGYILLRDDRPSKSAQREAISSSFLENVFDDDVIAPNKPVPAHLPNRETMLDMICERGGYQIVVASPSCLIIGRADGESILNRILTSNCSVLDCSNSEVLSQATAGYIGVSEFIRKAMGEIKSAANKRFYSQNKGTAIQKARAERRERALELYREGGLTNVDIARKVGISVPTFYRYIKQSK